MVGTGPSDSFYLPLSVKSYQASVALTSFLPLTSVTHFSKFLPEAAISRCFWRGMKSADWLGQVSQWNSTLRVNEFHEDECPWQEQWQGSMGGVPVAFVKHDRHWSPLVPLKTLWSTKKNDGVETGKWQGWQTKLFYPCLHMLCLLLDCSCLPLYPNKERLLNKWFMRITISTRRCYATVTRDWVIDQS